MIPLRDANPTRRTPVVTLAIVVACFVVFGWELGLQASGGDAALEAVRHRLGRGPGRPDRRLGSRRLPVRRDAPRCSPASSCTAAGCTCSATCSTCGSSATTSRTGSAALGFLLFYLVGGVAGRPGPGRHRSRRRRSRRSARPGRSPRRWAPTSCSSRGARVTSLVFLGFFYQLIDGPGGRSCSASGSSSSCSTGSARSGMTQGGGVAFFAHIGGFVFGALVAWLRHASLGRGGPAGRRGVG